MLEGFRHRIGIQVRLSDVDMMGHVNNSCYLSYVETARLRAAGADSSGRHNSDCMLWLPLKKPKNIPAERRALLEQFESAQQYLICSSVYAYVGLFAPSNHNAENVSHERLSPRSGRTCGGCVLLPGVI